MNISSFGPYRAAGMSLKGKLESSEIMALWGRFLPRGNELEAAEGGGSFGFCRCIPGATDGSWEYVAAIAVKDNISVPRDMIAVDVPGAEYAVCDVAAISDIRAGWESLAREVNSSDWTPYCGPRGCGCAEHPSFEYYPPEFRGQGPLRLYIPIHR